MSLQIKGNMEPSLGLPLREDNIKDKPEVDVLLYQEGPHAS